MLNPLAPSSLGTIGSFVTQLSERIAKWHYRQGDGSCRVDLPKTLMTLAVPELSIGSRVLYRYMLLSYLLLAPLPLPFPCPGCSNDSDRKAQFSTEFSVVVGSLGLLSQAIARTRTQGKSATKSQGTRGEPKSAGAFCCDG